MEGKDKAYFIRKAKRERGLSDEEIDYFLQDHPRWDLLPVYARFVRKFGQEEALNEVRRMYSEDTADRKE